VKDTRRRRALLAVLGAAVMTAAAAPAGASAGTTTTSRAVCTPLWGQAACLARVATDASGKVVSGATLDALGTQSAALTPASFHSAYNLPLTAPGTPTIAIVDAYDDPNAAADLAQYSATFGLPACTTANGCFRKVNQNGAPSPLPSANTGWSMEIALDVEVAHAVCQNCHILLVEATSPTLTNLGAAVNRAVAMGATVVSNSYGGSELAGEQVPGYYNHPYVAITASSGDSGFGVEYPAADPDVVAVGGTRLTLDASGHRTSETAWEGAGSGCSRYLPAQSFQTSIPNWGSTACGTHRAIADVSAVAAPDTGAAVYLTYGGAGWYQVGGTSLSSPLIAATFALGGPITTAYPAQLLYQHPGSLFDVTSGSNGSCPGSVMCHAGLGYDGPTGLGTPNGLGAF
jgi:subtilase family serine protease